MAQKFLMIIFTALILFSIPEIVYSEVQTLGTFKINTCVNLLQNCGNCTWVNITSVRYPDSTEALNNTAMEKHGTIYNYSFCINTQNGQYIVNGIGDVDGIITAFAYDYLVNPLGKTFTNSQSLLYILIFIIAFILFLICLLMGLYMPSGNKTDEMTGYIIAVSNLKYVKIFLLSISYILLVLMMYFGWMISYGYLDMDFLGNLFNIAFYILLILLPIIFVIGSYVVISNLIRDSKVSEALQMGVRIK